MTIDEALIAYGDGGDRFSTAGMIEAGFVLADEVRRLLDVEAKFARVPHAAKELAGWTYDLCEYVDVVPLENYAAVEHAKEACQTLLSALRGVE